MDKLLLAFGVVTALLVLAFLALTANVVVYSNEPYNLPAPAEPTYLKEELPNIERLKSPRAVLVLDVSGSMKQSDPQHLETQAAMRFYDVFLGLSREILDQGDKASIAIVLFGTIPQTIDWTGGNSTWLTVTAENREKFERTVLQMLGHDGHEPRRASHTDYLLAVQEIEEMTASLDSPPLVLFLTDGIYDPHPSLARDFLQSDGTRTTAQLLNSHGRLDARQILDGSLLDSKQPVLPKVGSPLSFSEMDQYRESLRLAVDKLLARKIYLSSEDQKPSALLWSPIYFGSNIVTLQEISRTLGSRSSSADSPNKVLHCQEAVDLVDNFVGILARWFRLHEISLANSTNQFVVPPQTQAFAIQLVTSAPVPRVAIKQSGREQSLSGSQTAWAGVASGDGQWLIDLPSGHVSRGTVYLRPRYDWVLHVPSQVSPAIDGIENIDIRLYFYSLEVGRPVDPWEIFPDLPPTLSGMVVLPNGEEKSFTLAKSNSEGSAYQGMFPLSEKTLGTLRVELDVSVLNATLYTQKHIFKKEVQLRPTIRFVLKNPDGQVTPLRVNNIPEASLPFLQKRKAP